MLAPEGVVYKGSVRTEDGATAAAISAGGRMGRKRARQWRWTTFRVLSHLSVASGVRGKTGAAAYDDAELDLGGDACGRASTAAYGDAELARSRGRRTRQGPGRLRTAMPRSISGATRAAGAVTAVYGDAELDLGSGTRGRTGAAAYGDAGRWLSRRQPFSSSMVWIIAETSRRLYEVVATHAQHACTVSCR